MNDIGPIKYLNGDLLTDVVFPNTFKVSTLNSISFKTPQLYSFSLESDSISDEEKLKLYKYRKYLTLLVQLPISNKSSFTVLEGDYTNAPMYITDVTRVDELDQKILSDRLRTNCELMSIDDNVTYAYCDKIVEYLTHNVISHKEWIENNISDIQRIINDTYKVTMQDANGELYTKSKCFEFEDGVWSNKLRYLIYKYYLSSDSRYNKNDVMGFVDSDVERFLRRLDNN